MFRIKTHEIDDKMLLSFFIFKYFCCYSRGVTLLMRCAAIILVGEEYVSHLTTKWKNVGMLEEGREGGKAWSHISHGYSITDKISAHCNKIT